MVLEGEMREINGEDGYELWLRYRPIQDPERLTQYHRVMRTAAVGGEGPTVELIRAELARALPVMLGTEVRFAASLTAEFGLLVGTAEVLRSHGVELPTNLLATIGRAGYLIRSAPNRIVVASNSDAGALRGTFHLLRLLQLGQSISDLEIAGSPRFHHRILAHWDNLDGSIERGYAGRSLWRWAALPDQLDPRYHDYARALASVGINGTCLNNVNANPLSLTSEYLAKAAALADLFRPYGIRVFLAPVFSAPIQIGALPTADPRDPAVAAWWRAKVDEIYERIPDFGGFQVKANSEGQPGPRDYGASHLDGANMLADALAPHDGLLLWRAFVYDADIDPDRAKCAALEFAPLDGLFKANVVVQVKNGPIDFQPREPFHPLFGLMEHTPLALELQIAQEYFGQSIHLVYLGEMWKEVLDADTYARRPGSSVARVVDGSIFGQEHSCIVAVANTGSDRNWCGHHFSQANLYAFGRLAWDHTLSAEAITEEWVRLTWPGDEELVARMTSMMLGSWPACIDYMTPLGLHHLMREGHHYGPDPGFNNAPRPDWNNVYFHRADRTGLGFDRSSAGSNAVAQYRSPLRELFDRRETCPSEYLLWFHHVPWDQRLGSGYTLWEELQARYQAGVEFVERIVRDWEALRPQIDPQRYDHVRERLIRQLESAREWRDVCLEYFGQFVQV